MKNTLKQKALAWMLAVTMAVSSCPTNVFAQETAEPTTEQSLSEDASKKEDILATNNHVYEKLSELFAQEVARDKWLLGYTLLKGKFTSEKKLAEIQNGIDKLLAEIKEKGNESHEEHKEISEKLDYIKKLITNPEMQAITLTTLQGG